MNSVKLCDGLQVKIVRPPTVDAVSDMANFIGEIAIVRNTGHSTSYGAHCKLKFITEEGKRRYQDYWWYPDVMEIVGDEES